MRRMGRPGVMHVEESARKETEDPVPRTIHMIWLGSPLPLNKFALGILSFVTLNPGEITHSEYKAI